MNCTVTNLALLAMLLREFGKGHPGFQFLVLATDISTRVLDKARLGIYDEEQTEPIPARLKQLYLMRSKDRRKELVRIVPELRDLVRFGRLNFMNANFGMPKEAINLDAVDRVLPLEHLAAAVMAKCHLVSQQPRGFQGVKSEALQARF